MPVSPLRRAVLAALLLAAPVTAAHATFETAADKAEAADAAELARADMEDAFGRGYLENGRYLWRKDAGSARVTRVVVDLADQMAYAYAGDALVGVSTISSGAATHPTPTGIFPILDKRRMHRSIKYDNAPMPYMQRLDDYGIALHAGHLPGHPASHGCIRLPAAFAARLFAATSVGTVVMIGDRGAARPASDGQLTLAAN